jgi:hypothetical protein
VAAGVVAAYTFAYGFLQLVWVYASDRWGRLGIIRVGLALASVATVASAFAPDIASLIVLRGIAGAGFAAVVPSTITYIGDRVPVEKRAGTLSDLVADVRDRGGYDRCEPGPSDATEHDQRCDVWRKSGCDGGYRSKCKADTDDAESPPPIAGIDPDELEEAVRKGVRGDNTCRRGEVLPKPITDGEQHGCRHEVVDPGREYREQHDRARRQSASGGTIDDSRRESTHEHTVSRTGRDAIVSLRARQLVSLPRKPEVGLHSRATR